MEICVNVKIQERREFRENNWNTKILRASPFKSLEEECLRFRDNERHWSWDLESVIRILYKSHRVLQKSYNYLLFIVINYVFHILFDTKMNFWLPYLSQNIVFFLLSDTGLFAQKDLSVQLLLQKNSSFISFLYFFIVVFLFLMILVLIFLFIVMASNISFLLHCIFCS